MKAVVRMLAVAVLVTVAASVGAPSPAQAATVGAACTSAGGITVVVDYQGLSSRPMAEVCDHSGQTNAATLFSHHFSVSYVTGSAGFVCKINGLGAQCAHYQSPYWSLWWAGPSDGTWHYSNDGVGSLEVPNGGFVAFSWATSGAGQAPRVAPVHATDTHPTPVSASSASAPRTQTPSPSGSRSAPMRVPPSASTHPSAKADISASVSASTSGSGSVAPTPSATPSSGSTGGSGSTADNSTIQTTSAPTHGLPWWIAPAIIALLGAAAGAIWFVRRRP